MPSTRHEALLEVFRHRPDFTGEVRRDMFGIAVPRYEQARLEPGDFTDLTPTGYRADAAAVLTATEGPVFAVVVSATGPVASWSAQPISLGHPDWTLKPLVLGPDQVPVVVTVAQAQ